ncbi:MAG: type IV pilus twitching motility protein PilT [Planctomycetota bacterium]|nr:type IV pilus twitching motility protein PilT [Planctomycetota bacterium]
MAQLDILFHTMLERKASDVILTVGSKPCLKIAGDIAPLEEFGEVSPEDAECVLHEVMPERSRQEFEQTNDTDFAYEVKGVGRLRCNVFRNRLGMGGVFRLIPDKIITVEDLNLPKAITDLCFLSKGLVVVTGPTGSGKSTTLCALVDLINRRRKAHIITIEDPIEFVHPNRLCLISQREVGTHTTSFKKAMRAALREAPDIVLIGEMRDLETIETAIETAETGHLVFGTLHTTTAASTVDRIIDQFPADRQQQIRVMLSTSLKAVIAQTLLKKRGGGRIAALEVLLITSAMSSLIREAKTYQIPSQMTIGRKLGMQSLNDSLVELVKKDIVTPEDAYIKAMDKEELVKRLKEECNRVVDLSQPL